MSRKVVFVPSQAGQLASFALQEKILGSVPGFDHLSSLLPLVAQPQQLQSKIIGLNLLIYQIARYPAVIQKLRPRLLDLKQSLPICARSILQANARAVATPDLLFTMGRDWHFMVSTSQR